MKKISEILLQALLIFLSVFLGVIAGNWNEDKKEEEKVKIFLVHLSRELAGNRQSLEKSIPYHERLGAVADSLFLHSTKAVLNMTMATYGGLQDLPGWQGLGIGAVDQHVYESGFAGGVLQNLPMNLLTDISKVRSFQQEYIRFSRSVSDKLLNYSADTRLIDYLVILQILGNDLLTMEKAMHQAYGQLLQSLEQELKR